MEKETTALAALASGLALGALLVMSLQGSHPGFSGSFHTGPSLEQIRDLADLVTLKVDVADVQETRIAGYTGGISAALLVKGDFLLAVDLSQAKFEQVDEAGHKAVLVLPPPQIRSPRIDHDRTRVFALSTQGLWLMVPGDAAQTAVVNQAYQEAQRIVGQAAESPALHDRCRRNAERVLAGFFKSTGWDVRIRWRPPPPPEKN